MKRFLLSIIFTSCIFCKGFAIPDPILAELMLTLDQEHSYDSAKVKSLEVLTEALNSTDSKDYGDIFKLTVQLCDAYKVYNYDSAYCYARKMLWMAKASGDPKLITTARLKISFILLSAGLYRETFDTLGTINIVNSLPPVKAEYYTLMARYYYDLAGYEADKYHSVDYDIIASHYMDSALVFYPYGSFEANYYSGLKLFKQGKLDAASVFFEKLMVDTSLTGHELALTASTLSGVYLQRGRTDDAMTLLARAAIADIQTSTKETFAIYNLAELLYKAGDVKYASLCIENAIANANFYNARQRKAQASSILSLIESERINAIDAQRRIAIQYAIAATIFLVVLTFLIVVIRRQVKKLQTAKRIITEAHVMQQEINGKLETANNRLEETNNKLEATNNKLEDTNGKLEDANKIKEGYIGYFFKIDSEYFARLEKLKTTIEKKLTDRKFDDIKFIINNIKPQREKEELLLNFDKVFLRIFPNFVAVFNSFFHPEDQVILTPNELLNTDLRIYALIRIGISENEKIAEILGYSINTIYTYKTRIKNKSIISNDDFERKIMEIRSV